MSENNNDQKYNNVWIPPNLFNGGDVLGFRKKNIREGAVIALIVCVIICQFPFLDRVKLILCLFIGFGIIAASAFGVKGRSPSEFIIDVYRYRNSPRSYHMRSIKDSKSKELVYNQEKGKIVNANKSYAEQIAEFIESQIKKFKEQSGKKD